MGDGQQLSLRLQKSRFYETYIFSLGFGLVENSKQFSTPISQTTQYRYNY